MQTCACQCQVKSIPWLPVEVSAHFSLTLKASAVNPQFNFLAYPHPGNFPLLTNQISQWPANPHSHPLHLLFNVQFKPHFPGRASLPTQPGVTSHTELLPFRRGTLRNQEGRVEERIAEFIHELKCVCLPTWMSLMVTQRTCVPPYAYVWPTLTQRSWG